MNRGTLNNTCWSIMSGSNKGQTPTGNLCYFQENLGTLRFSVLLVSLEGLQANYSNIKIKLGVNIVENLLRLVRAALLVLIAISCKSALAADQLTGAWHGTILGKSIELALWSDRRDTGSEWLEWKGYFYSPHYDCFMTAHVSYKGEKTAVSFTSLGIENRKNNCRNNLKGKRSAFKSDGRFDLQHLPTELSSVFDFLMFDDFKLVPKKTEPMVLHRGVSSNEMLAFIQEHKHRYILKPSTSDLAILNNKFSTNTVVSDSTENTPKHGVNDGLKQSLPKSIKVVKQHKQNSSNEPKIPDTLNNFYIASPGLVTQLVGGNRNLSEYVRLPSTLQQDMGVSVNDYLGNAEYHSLKSSLYMRESIKIPPQLTSKYSHCNGGSGRVYSNWSEFSVNPLKLPDGKFSTEIFVLKNKDPRGICVYPVTGQTSCKVIKCNKYEKSTASSILTSNKSTAFSIGRSNPKKKAKSYSERKQEMQLLHEENSSTNQPGYFDRFGDCGNISCDEQTINDFVIDQYFFK